MLLIIQHVTHRFNFEIGSKHKIFISYHHGGDQAYYDGFSRVFGGIYDVIYDNSLERKVDSEDTTYVIRRIREHYVTGSSCTVVLVGRDTWGRKYVDWEILATLEKQHGLIGMRLPTALVNANNNVTVPGRLYDNIVSRYALWVTWNMLMQKSADLAEDGRGREWPAEEPDLQRSRAPDAECVSAVLGHDLN